MIKNYSNWFPPISLREISQRRLPSWWRESKEEIKSRLCWGLRAPVKHLPWRILSRRYRSRHWFWRTIRPWRRSSAASFANFSQHPQSSILSATMIIISQKLISLRRTLILKRILRLMTKSTSSVTLRPQPCPNAEMSLLWPAFPAFIAWVTRLITAPWLFLCGRECKKTETSF